MQVQQVLPCLARLGRLLAGQQRFAQPEASLDNQRVIDVLAEELAVQVRRLLQLVQLLLALSDQQLDPHAAVQLRPDTQCAAVEIERPLVVRLLILLGWLEIRVGEFHVQAGDFLLPILGQQELCLGAVDEFGGAEIAFASQRQTLGEAGLACPRAVVRPLIQLVERSDGLVVFLLEVQRAAFQVGQMVLVGLLVAGQRLDRRDRFRILAILHQLKHLFRHRGRRGRQAVCRHTQRTHRDQRRRTCTEHDGPPSRSDRRNRRPIPHVYTSRGKLGRISSDFIRKLAHVVHVPAAAVHERRDSGPHWEAGPAAVGCLESSLLAFDRRWKV